MVLLRQWRACLRRDVQLAGASPLVLAWQVGTVVLAAPTLFYLGRLIRPAASPHLQPFGGDYFAFVILGVGLFGFLAAAMVGAAAAVRQEQVIGTLEILLAAPISAPVLVLGLSLWHLVTAGGQALLYLILGAAVFGLGLAGANIVAVVLSVGLAVVIYGALGVASAAFVLLFRHPDPITNALVGISALLSGVFYPTSVLPPLLARLAQVIPLTHALRALRLAVLQGYGPAALRQELLILAGFAALLVPLAGVVLRLALRHARAAGTLAAY